MTTTAHPTGTLELTATPTRNPLLQAWVQEVVALTRPDRVLWCDGSQEEADRLTDEMVDAGTLIRLDPAKRPNSFLARTDPGDVARLEGRTFIACARQEDAGPLNNWREPTALREELAGVFEGCMRGRTMYVVPFCLGSPGSPLSQVGVQLTDSPYVVVGMRVMTRVGKEALDLLDAGEPFAPAVHSVGHPLVDVLGRARPDVAWPCNDAKYVAHFPETREVWSFGSGYGGNALLGKKCLGLRIASVVARDSGWLAEHMLLVRLTSPAGRAFHVAAAFPSACGKTNLAMLRPALPGWRVETIGDDITWMRPGADGRLWAVNPETGFFGVAPGTGPATNPAAVEMLRGNTVFTNVALTDDGDVWWEGLTAEPPAHLTDWRGEDWTPASGTPAAHPNARFTVPVSQCPTMAPDWDDPRGVPLDAVLLGGRRATNVPLVAEALSWEHGVFLGATTASERTAAAEGTVGELRRDPFAMAPFTGYHAADHWRHWLAVGRSLPAATRPRFFAVNWFRRDADGGFLWPGFGENIRVLAWICGRLEGTAAAAPSPAGWVPAAGALDVDGLDLPPAALRELFAVDGDAWRAECDATERWLEGFAPRVPEEVHDELESLRYRLSRL
ncbi:phosphoenolpyruvate carboxykinase (GTP) [Kineococcus sp. NUM-3379]